MHHKLHVRAPEFDAGMVNRRLKNYRESLTSVFERLPTLRMANLGPGLKL
jgi:hypothetical protein